MVAEQRNSPLLEVFDPVMGCSDGVCGPDAGEEQIKFAGAVRWLKSKGIEVKRYNMGKEPKTFRNRKNVIDKINRQGQEILPLILVNDQLMHEGSYPALETMARWFELEHE